MGSVDGVGADRRTNPLFNDNRMKLGIFAVNASHGCSATLAEGHLETTWGGSRRVTKLADAAGIEAMVPVARWRGFGGPTRFNSETFETFTWAAGMAEATEHAAIFATSHVPTLHPIVAAKQATTIDHISGGRFALNVVCGWFQPEQEMFGVPIMPHDTRYEYAAEWLEVVRLLWTSEDEFDYEGRFFRVPRGFHQPKPVQQPYPPTMNAGGSPVGQRFAAQQVDIAFTLVTQQDFETVKGRVDNIRRLAREYGRGEIQVWLNGYVVCRPTEGEAREYLHYYAVEKGDYEAIDNLLRVMGIQTGNLPPEHVEQMKLHFVAGWGGYPLIGTPEQLVDQLAMLSRAGIDGTILSWVNYEAELQQWIDEVMPLLEQAGLRKPFRGGQTVGMAGLESSQQRGAEAAPTRAD
jgi:alkanesulfonate monooxygenase SsuD/methylene tetrahydromethanopterin reductase-like flavin-dependent oxidoreductase (luciferase family)